MISKTTIVIITYNPNINNLNNVLSELNQVYHIVVSDNASQNIIDIKKPILPYISVPIKAINK